MAHLIDKDALVAEIEKEIKHIYAGREYVGIPSDEENMVRGIQRVEDILDTLEVKEVDLEKELIKWHKEHFKKDGTFIGMSGFYLTNNSQMDIAKYFFELGLKAQKGK